MAGISSCYPQEQRPVRRCGFCNPFRGRENPYICNPRETSANCNPQEFQAIAVQLCLGMQYPPRRVADAGLGWAFKLFHLSGKGICQRVSQQINDSQERLVGFMGRSDQWPKLYRVIDAILNVSIALPCHKAIDSQTPSLHGATSTHSRQFMSGSLKKIAGRPDLLAVYLIPASSSNSTMAATESTPMQKCLSRPPCSGLPSIGSGLGSSMR